MSGDDDWIQEDGGWEDMVDDGHRLAEYMLDTPHPYDLHGHKPADRFGTRQQIVSERFADAGSLADDGRLPVERTIVSAGRSRPPRQASSGRPTASAPAAGLKPRRGTPQKSSAQAQAARRSQQPTTSLRGLNATAALGVSPPKGKNAGRIRARAEAAARELGMNASDVSAIVRCGLPAAAILNRLPITQAQLNSVRKAFSRATASGVAAQSATSPKSANRPGKPKQRSQRPSAKLRRNPTVTTVVKRPAVVQQIRVCPSCEGPIGANDRCQCS